MGRPPRRYGHFYLSDLVFFFVLAGAPAALGAGRAIRDDLTYFILNVVACPAIMWWSVSCLNAFEILPTWKRSLFHGYAWVTWVALVGAPILLTAALTRDAVLFADPWVLGALLVAGDVVFVASFVFVNHRRKKRLGLAVSALPVYCARWGAFLAFVVLLFWAPVASSRSRNAILWSQSPDKQLSALSLSLKQYESAHPGFVLEPASPATEELRREASKRLDGYWFKRKGIETPWDCYGIPLVIRLLPGDPVDKNDPRLVCFGKRWLIIYSTGRNRKDEDGKGDDVPIGASAE